jgi:hypothetical protein
MVLFAETDKNKSPDKLCRGSEYYSKSIGHAITIPERSLYATTNSDCSPVSWYYKSEGESVPKQIFFKASAGCVNFTATSAL